MLKLNLFGGISRKFFNETNGIALSAVLLLFFSCNEENPISNELESGLVKEYAFINPDDTLNISLCEAEDIASLFMDELGGIDNTFKSAGAHHSSSKTFVIPDDNLEPAVYAINLDPDGFCIVAATKKIETILAYSDQGKFDPDNLPIGVADWLGEKIEVIQEVRNDAVITTTKNTKYYLKPVKDRDLGEGGFETTSIKTYGPLLKTTWGQSYPYNHFCPAGCPGNDKERKLAGCVPVATAQIIRYWEPFFAYKLTLYSWNKMPNKGYNYSEEYVRSNDGYLSMARLIHDVGLDLNVKYGCESSPAKTEDIPNVLIGEYEFACGGYYQELSNEEAIIKITNDIKKKRPVIMNGKDHKRNIVNILKKILPDIVGFVTGTKKSNAQP